MLAVSGTEDVVVSIQSAHDVEDSARPVAILFLRIVGVHGAHVYPLSEAVSRPTAAIADETPDPVSRRGIFSVPVSDTPTRNHPPIDNDNVDDTFTSLATGTPVLSDSYPTQLRTMSSVTTQPTNASKSSPLPPVSLGLSLLEIYFTRVYNANLLFHKPLIFQSYLAGELNGSLLRAMLSLATIFLHPINSDDSEETSDTPGSQIELNILSPYQPYGIPWANAAWKEAMLSIRKEPTLVTIQTLVCLQLYWFCVGQPCRANICLALAYHCCHLAGYSKKKPEGTDNSDYKMESELGRRCFWASWASMCIVMEPEPYVQCAWEQAAMVPLPGCISSGGGFILIEKMDENWHSSPVNPINDEKDFGVETCFIKMMGVWAKIQLLCKDYTSSSVAQNFDYSQKLSRLATSLFEDTYPPRVSDRRAFNPPGTHSLKLVHDTLYRQCQITIHSMIVPLFSGIPTDPSINLETQREAAETVIKHADVFQCLLEPYLSGRNHVSFLSPLVGYAAFVAAIVLLATEVSCRGKGVDILPAQWETLRSALETDLQHRAALKSTEPQRSQPTTRGNTQRADEAPGSHMRDTNGRHGQLESSMMDMGQETFEPERPNPVSSNGGFIQASNDMGLDDDSLISHVDLPHDYEWYSLSFADSGIEQFAGLEPTSLFQQGWGAFG
ncbi:hypothetical protein N7456_001145 [Penicillium angulare]|uniref:Xylanolytic transcriptional activator regulatory domain-containing protein n=1 Tax=Penicillium angulare TaxID=116970 RepID=A0A9W9GDV4_9EURO|nr:hypothetical protein N7456_001145 [Penicillium angulare]